MVIGDSANEVCLSILDSTYEVIKRVEETIVAIYREREPMAITLGFLQIKENHIDGARDEIIKGRIRELFCCFDKSSYFSLKYLCTSEENVSLSP